MKKFVSIALVLCILMSGIISVQAQTITKEDFGMKFDLPDNWVDKSNDKVLYFVDSENTNEAFTIELISFDWAYDISFISEATLKKICDNLLSDSRLSERLSNANGIDVVVLTQNTVNFYTSFGKERYYVYRKNYRAISSGYKATDFYSSYYITAKNGKLYIIEYANECTGKNLYLGDFNNIVSSIDFSIGDIKILMNNERIFPDTSPILKNDRTMVPTRAVAEKMGYTVSWDEATETVTMTSADKGDTLQLVIGNDYIMKNNSKKISLDVPAFVLNDRTYLPLRAVTEAVGAKVDWDEETKSVIITY